MKIHTVFLILLTSLLSAQEIHFSQESSWSNQEFLLALSGADSIWYTTNGKIPIPGSNYTYFYKDSILIKSLEYEPYLILNRLKDFTSDSVHFYSQTKHSRFDFADTPTAQEVPKKTIIRACSGNCDAIFTRSYGIGNYNIAGWEVELIFDNPELVWDKDSGAFAPGAGSTAPWLFAGMPNQPDSILVSNYEIRNRLHQLRRPTISRPSGLPQLFENFPLHWDKLNATVLFYANNQFVGQETAEVRPNGNGRIHRPLKSWKIKLDNALSSQVAFAATKNFVARERRRDGIFADVGMEIANSWKTGPKISREVDHGVIHVYNGAFLECFGVYSLVTAVDNKFAKHYWAYNKPQKHEGDNIYESFFGLDTSDIAKTYRLLQDTTTLFQNSRDSLRVLIGDEIAWMKKLLSYAFLRPESSWNVEIKAIGNKHGKNVMPILKDGDSYLSFEQAVYDGQLTVSSFDLNQLAFFVTRDTSYWPDIEMAEDINWGHTWAVYAALFHPENKAYYQNLLLDGYEEAYRYEKTKPILDKMQQTVRDNYALNQSINKIIAPWNDSLTYEKNAMLMDSFLHIAGNEFLGDWIEFFHPGHSLADTFIIHVNMDNIAMAACGKTEGTVFVNSLNFENSGKRIHVQDFPIQIKAKPSPGYVFKEWIEFPNEGESIILVNNSNVDVTLTPVFEYKSEMCQLHNNIKLNEVQAWNPSGSDKLELYNATSESISLCGLCITDNPTKPCKEIFTCDSSTVIAANSYFVIDFKKADGGDYLIESFSLNRDGESIGIYTPDSLLIDEMSWAVVDSISYGYCPGSSDFTALDSLTWGKENFCLETSLKENYKNDIQIFPNPTNGSLFIKNFQDNQAYIINDITGKPVKEGHLEKQLNISELTAGLYILRTLEDQVKIVVH